MDHIRALFVRLWRRILNGRRTRLVEGSLGGLVWILIALVVVLGRLTPRHV
jgi:hypothetical protein